MKPTAATLRHRFSIREWGRLLVLCAALLFEGMSLSSVNVQLAEIQNTLGLTLDELQLVASSFLTCYACLLLFSGTCADKWGARQLFMVGVALFGMASLWAALAPGTVQLIIARALQGAGAALTAPAAIALITHEFPAEHARNKAFGVLSAMGAVGFSLGVVAGGLLTDVLGWRWVFAAYVPLAVIVLLTGLLLLRPTTGSSTKLPWLPATLITGSLFMIVYAIGRVGTASTIETLIVVGAATALLTTYVIQQRRVPLPLIPLALLTHRRMAAACIALGGSFAAITAVMFLTSTALQEQQDYTPFAAGLAFLPQGLAVSLISTFAATAATRWSPRAVLFIGMVVLTAGQLLYTGTLDSPYATRLLPACLLVGAGIAGLYPAATILASASATADQQATASGLLTTCQQAGGALGVALVAAVGGGVEGLWLAAATMLGTLLTVVILSVLRHPATHQNERQRVLCQQSHSNVIDSYISNRQP